MSTNPEGSTETAVSSPSEGVVPRSRMDQVIPADTDGRSVERFGAILSDNFRNILTISLMAATSNLTVAFFACGMLEVHPDAALVTLVVMLTAALSTASGVIVSKMRRVDKREALEERRKETPRQDLPAEMSFHFIAIDGESYWFPDVPPEIVSRVLGDGCHQFGGWRRLLEFARTLPGLPECRVTKAVAVELGVLIIAPKRITLDFSKLAKLSIVLQPEL